MSGGGWGGLEVMWVERGAIEVDGPEGGPLVSRVSGELAGVQRWDRGVESR